MRVDDPPNRFGGQLPHRRQHLFAHLRGTGIHDNHTFIANLHGDIRTGADQHVYISLDVKNFDFALCSRLWLRPGTGIPRRARWRGEGSGFNFRHELRVCCVCSRKNRIERKSELVGELFNEWILPGQEVRHLVFWFGDLHRVFAVVQPVLIAAFHQYELFTGDVWLRQIHRIGSHRDVRQEISVTDVMFNHCRQIATGNAAAAVELFFDVRGRNGQNVAVPFPC